MGLFSRAKPSPSAAERHDQIKKDQIAALDAALMDEVPKSPIEKIRATIRFGELRLPLLDDNYRDTGRLYSTYTVDMLVGLPEADRAIILKHNLDFIELENEPMFSEQDFARLEQNVAPTNDPVLAAVQQSSREQALLMMRAERRKTTLGDLLVAPYRRQFKTEHDAKEHAERIKTKLLPKLREVLDRYKEHKTTETLEF